MVNSRKEAIDILFDIETNQGYSNIALDKALREKDLSKKDKAFITTLIYGTIEKKITLEYIVSKYSKTPLKKLRPFILTALKTALYQIIFMDKIPDSAAVNETVAIVRKSKYRNLGGFVNAILRNFLRDGKTVSYPTDEKEFLSVKYSISPELVDLFLAQYSSDTEKIFKGFEELSGVTLKVNTLKISTEELYEKLSENCEVTVSSLCDDLLILKGQGSVRDLYGFDEGYFHIQDTASAICAKTVSELDGERVLDVCAAPGGKSFSIAEYMDDKGEVVSLDLYPHKVELIKNGAERLGLNSVKAFVNDAEKFNSDLGKFNKVLCDLPCSGLGILAKKPEIRYKNVSFVDNLPLLQYHLLETSKLYVEVGGFLFYSTCTLNIGENTEVVKKFLKNNSDFEPVKIGEGYEKTKYDLDNTLTLFPHIHKTDGFFISAFKRVR